MIRDSHVHLSSFIFLLSSINNQHFTLEGPIPAPRFFPPKIISLSHYLAHHRPYHRLIMRSLCFLPASDGHLIIIRV